MKLEALLSEAQCSIARSLALPEAESRIESQILMRYALGDVTRAWLLTHEQVVPPLEQQEKFQLLLQCRLSGEPIAYILGRREFFGLNFNVTPDVLIPRPDTELLVELALECIPREQPSRVLDLGTGSGAIAISVASQRPLAEVTAVDASAAALKVAHSNAEQLHTPNVRLLQSDWFTALVGETFDVVVSNPPYIAQDDVHLTQGDLRFEPKNALASGEDGLDNIRAIVRVAPQHLTAGGWMLLEHGYDQAQQVADLLWAQGFTQVESRPDLAGVLRVTLGKAAD
jgi:release factor glutamine methyltransferase